MRKHIIWMVIGCTIPLLLIFFAPALGLSSSWALFLFIIAMFACHLLMPHHARLPDGQGAHGHNHNKENSETKKENSHEHSH